MSLPYIFIDRKNVTPISYFFSQSLEAGARRYLLKVQSQESSFYFGTLVCRLEEEDLALMTCWKMVFHDSSFKTLNFQTKAVFAVRILHKCLKFTNWNWKLPRVSSERKEFQWFSRSSQTWNSDLSGVLHFICFFLALIAWVDICKINSSQNNSLFFWRVQLIPKHLNACNSCKYMEYILTCAKHSTLCNYF